MLLAAALDERDALGGIEVEDMVRRALGFIARTGPATEQDRWEENAGLNPFTLAVAIAALVAGAGLLPPPAADWALELADFWNRNIERWTAVAGTPLADRLGVKGYYVRVAAATGAGAPADIFRQVVPIRNRADHAAVRADELVGTDFLQLVRFGLRRADDPLILDSVRVADALLKTDTPSGPVWHRYNCDGYGEHDDGSAYDGTGRGRGWPLLTGERGHYELAAGHDPLPYLEAMAAMASPGGMMPEQVWDAEPIPSRRLAPGRPTGSAMPLVWAHAEFIKLLISRHLGHPVDRPRAVWQRYRGPPADGSSRLLVAARPDLRLSGRDQAGAGAAAAGNRALGPGRVAGCRRRADPRQRPWLSCRGARGCATGRGLPHRFHLAVAGIGRVAQSRLYGRGRTRRAGLSAGA